MWVGVEAGENEVLSALRVTLSNLQLTTIVQIKELSLGDWVGVPIKELGFIHLAER